MPSLPLFQVDAFTDCPFHGNPAAVCQLAQPVEDRWMQQVAAEMNLAETAFVMPEEDAFRLRWFTPVVEVDLCGHATLATAHVLFSENMVPPNQSIVFRTRSGQLIATCTNGEIGLDFPNQPPAEIDWPDDLAQTIDKKPKWSGTNGSDILIELDSADDVREIQVDFPQLATRTDRGLIVTAASDDPRFDFISRFFAPAVGIDEDPVTGSAHCCLTPFWAARLGRQEMRAFQASPRGGALTVRLAGDRVHLRGRAVTVLRGSLLVDT